MPLAIVQAVMGNAKSTPISIQIHGNTKKRISKIKSMIAAEQMFDVVFSNYVDLEKQMIEATSDHMFYMTTDHSRFQEAKLSISRRIINLLTANRMYVDQIPQHVLNILGENDQAAQAFQSIFSEMYDKHLAYRFFEALRNYVQHRGFPIQSCTYPSKWVDDGDTRRIEFNCSFYLEISELKTDGKFKKAVLKELEEIGEQIDIKEMARVYMECIYQIHCRFRLVVKDCIDKACTSIRKLIERHAGGCEDARVGLYVVELQLDGAYSKLYSLNYKNLYYLESLRDRHKTLNRLSKYCISTHVFRS